MKVTVMVEYEEETITVVQQGRDADEVLVCADKKMRERLGLRDHIGAAYRFLAGLPHPEAEVLENWRNQGFKTLSDLVEDLRPLISNNSVGWPHDQPCTGPVHDEVVGDVCCQGPARSACDIWQAADARRARSAEGSTP